jgi:hypothetical protein
MYKCIIYDTTRFKAVMVDGGSVHKRGRWVQRGGDCDVPHRLGMRMCLYV